MRKVRIWRFIIMSIISVCLIFVVPWLKIEGGIVTFTSDSFNTITLSILSSGIIYLGVGFLANGLKNKSGKLFGVVNALIGFAIIIILSIYTFTDIETIAIKMTYFMPLFSLLTVDLVLAIIHVSIRPGVQQNQSIQKTQTIEGHQFSNNLDEGLNMNINTSQIQDVSELKNKILNMKSGLSKSYEEAIDEIERTGALSGLDMSELLKNDNEVDRNRIIPYSVEEQYYQQPKRQEQHEPAHYTPTREQNSSVQDPIANSSNDYESIHSSSLSRKDYKYISRRNDIDENKH